MARTIATSQMVHRSHQRLLTQQPPWAKEKDYLCQMPHWAKEQGQTAIWTWPQLSTTCQQLILPPLAKGKEHLQVDQHRWAKERGQMGLAYQPQIHQHWVTERDIQRRWPQIQRWAKKLGPAAKSTQTRLQMNNNSSCQEVPRLLVKGRVLVARTIQDRPVLMNWGVEGRAKGEGHPSKITRTPPLLGQQQTAKPMVQQGKTGEKNCCKKKIRGDISGIYKIKLLSLELGNANIGLSFQYTEQ
jgi:hypothetical protein